MSTAPPSGLERIGDAIADGCLYLAGAALLAIVAINGINVVGRYFFAAPLTWAEEAMLYLMILLVFAAGATVTWRGLHMRLDALIDRVPPAIRTVAVYGSGLAGIAILLAIGTASFEIVSMLHAFDQRSDALEIPMWIPQSCVLVGFGLFAILTALRLVVFGAALPPAIDESLAEDVP